MFEDFESNNDQQNVDILDDSYILNKKIGDGATSNVFLAQSIHGDSSMAAIKILKASNSESYKNNYKHFQREIEMLKKIQHKNIINITNGKSGALIQKADNSSERVDYIALELAENGELFDYIYFLRKGFGEDYGRYLFREIINGLNAVHQAGVVHRDLKTENIMMTKDWTLKIADFGYSTLKAGKENNNILDSFLGTLSYAAPEILRRKPYNGVAIDIFSTGAILYILVTGKLPFLKAVINDDDNRELATKDFDSYFGKKDLKIGKTKDEFKSLISLMLSNDPMERRSINEIIEHPWMKIHSPSEEEMKIEFQRIDKVVRHIKEMEQIEEKKAMERRAAQKGSNSEKRIFKGENEETKNNNGNIIEYLNNSSDTNNEKNKKVKLKPYELRFNNYKFIVKKIKALEFLDNLVAYFNYEDECSTEKRQKKIQVNKDEFEIKVTYHHSKEFLQSLKDIKLQELEFKIELKSVDYSKGVLCEFIKLNGDKMEFLEVFSNCIDFFGEK